MKPTVVVAGAFGEFGRAFVQDAGEAGYEVVALDLQRSIDTQPPLDGSGASLTLPVDARDASSVSEAFAVIEENVESVDALVSFVGYMLVPPKAIDDVTDVEWADVLHGNLTTFFNLCRAGLPALRRGTGPSAIVAVSSGLAIDPIHGTGPYSAAKSGLHGLVKTLAVENAPKIRVNAVAPSAADTNFLQGGTGRDGSSHGREWFDAERYQQTVPMDRLCEPRDVSDLVLFLLSNQASYITGQIVHLNGGKRMP